MDTNPSHHIPYTSLPASDPSITTPRRRRPLKGFAVILTSILFLISLIGLILNQSPKSPSKSPPNPQSPSSLIPTPIPDIPKPPRGAEEGVSAKSNPSFSDEDSYNWTNAMFSWQRTSFHFQPQRNWMNDPDGPLYHLGWYHLFYQYNPDSAVWGNITWGHAVSKDLIHWLYLPFAMIPDQWYDINGVWTGSATLLPDGQIVVLYTGDTNDTVQVQNLAYPANLSDPLLLDWVKYDGNPVITPPNGINSTDFRDPTTAWVGSDGQWRLIIGSKFNGTGLSLVYTTTDFKTYEALDHVLHSVSGTGMWECVDFYPVSTNGSNGLDTSVNGPGVKHVLKASLDETKRDVYAIGTYDSVNDTWTPDNPEADVGIGLEVDYGRYYASKTFYDQHKERRILWGWINETDTEDDDVAKGWASVMTIPREVTFDIETGTNILQWPVEEVETLRLNSTEISEVEIGPGSVVLLDIGTATQLDIIAEFEYEFIENVTIADADGDYGCGGGAIDRTSFGPFGLLVIADESLSELTPVYFRIFNTSDGNLKTLLCADETRSTKAPEIFNQVYGGKVPVLEGEALSLRVLVDHSIVESFAQGGRTVITSRVYPTEAIYGAAKVFLFNNATGINVKANLTIWQMNSAFIHPFPFE